jgi:hypothetical protein
METLDLLQEMLTDRSLNEPEFSIFPLFKALSRWERVG